MYMRLVPSEVLCHPEHNPPPITYTIIDIQGGVMLSRILSPRDYHRHTGRGNVITYTITDIQGGVMLSRIISPTYRAGYCYHV